ncbi:MAG: CPBP family intramembrane metalloprotease [Candidatus Omnitrophica bacterium]|nr:CPBP family intramembrane metalloprotease [Candidatus Omnitrophota bacterium]
MNLKKRLWIVYVFSALLSIFIWYVYSYPQMTFVHLKVDRIQALRTANDYVLSLEPDLHEFNHAITFNYSQSADRYLQKSVGFDGLKKFLEEYNYDLFFWSINYFKEGEKERYAVTVSSRTGEIIGYSHSIDDTAKIEIIPKDDARNFAVDFLVKRFHFNPEEYELKGDLTTKYDFRDDHTFSWKHKNVSIPWTEQGGTGKLQSSVTVSGDQILSFHHNVFHVPEDFNRDLAKKSEISNNIGVVVRNINLFFFISAIFFVVSRRNHLAMHTTKKVYSAIAIFMMLLSVLGFFNSFESVLGGYSTTSSFNSYLIRLFISLFIGTFIASFYILMPGLAGELLHFEVFKEKKRGSLLTYIHSTFFSRDVARSIFLGYFVFVILLGIQTIIIKLGQKYCGVWVEYSSLSTFTTPYFPFLAGITLGVQASFSEEILYRMFGISFGKKLFKNTVFAVIVVSLLWGFGHAGYPVYPTWFRAIEVSILGFFLSFIYLRYGLICTLVAHYVFDVFWHTAGYLFGDVSAHYVISSVFILALPFIFAVIAFIVNKTSVEKPMRWHLNRHQLFNLNILLTYLNAHKNSFQEKSAEKIKEEIAGHGWDYAVVDMAVDDFLGKKAKDF